MERAFRPILNTDRIGETKQIVLPGFEYAKKERKEPCLIHYLEYGEGEPLILVHSVGQSIYTWRNLMPILAQYYRVIAFDLVGAGFSGRPDSMNYSMDEVADSILMFMEALGLEKTNILGFSLGGMYTLTTVSKEPERFNKVIVLQAGDVNKAMPKKVVGMAKSPFGALVRENYSKKHVRDWLQECNYDSTAIDKEVVEQYFETVDDFASRQAIMYSLRNFDYEYGLSLASTIAKEVLVLWAAEDRWQPLEQMEILKKNLKKGIYHVIRNAGHLMHEEKAEVVAEVVDKYLMFVGENA